MLKSGKQIRLTQSEIEEASKLGLNLVGIKTQAQYSDAVIELVELLDLERPGLLEKIAQALAEKTGIQLPAKLEVVPLTLRL